MFDRDEERLPVSTRTDVGSGPQSVHGGQRWWDRVICRLLSSSAHRTLSGSLAILRLHGAVSGRQFELPVQYAQDADAVIVAPARPEAKLWWRNLRVDAPVEVLVRGRWVAGRGKALGVADPDYASTRETYRKRWPRVPLSATNPIVRITMRRTDGTADGADAAR